MQTHQTWSEKIILGTSVAIFSACLTLAHAASLPVHNNTLGEALSLLSEGAPWAGYRTIKSIRFQTSGPKTASDDGVFRQLGHIIMRDGHTMADLSLEGNPTTVTEIKLDISLRGRAKYPKIVEVIQSNLPSATISVIADNCESLSVEEDAPQFIEAVLPSSQKIYVSGYTDRTSTAHGDFSAQYYSFTKYKPVESIKNAHCKTQR